MTALDLDAIEARANAATPGPWEIIGGGEYVTGINIGIGTSDGGIRERDAKFVARVRSDVPALVAEVRRLSYRPTVERLSQMMREHFFGSDVPADECDDCAREFLSLLPNVGEAS